MKSLTLSRGARISCALTTIFIAGAVWFSAPALAASDSQSGIRNSTPFHDSTGTVGHAASGSLSGTIVRTIVALLIVIAVIYGLTWLLKQSRTGRNPSVGEGLTQVASLPLGPHRSVALVRVGAELHMLGVAEHGINGIRVFSEEEAYELGIPFDPDDFDTPSRVGGVQPAQRVVDALRRLTVR
jgi:flagellar protein FliO/FliZ